MTTPASLHPGDLVRIRGDRWRIARHVTHGACALVEARGCDRANRGERASFILPAESIERVPMCDRPRVVRPRRWRRAARTALGAATDTPTSLLTAARAAFHLLPFQLEPALAVTSGAACRLLIADEVGLGKTIQAALVIAELLERAADGRALVVTPAGLREQWQRELERWLHLEAAIVDSAALARMPGAMVNPWVAHRLVLTSVDFIKRPEVLRSVEALVWDVVVFDEAHALAGRSDRAEAAGALATRARHVVMLTATPHAGDDAAFERLCRLGDIDHAFPLLMFRRTRADAGLPASRRTAWLRVHPTEAELRMHRALADYTRAVWRTSEVAAARLAMSVLARRAASSAASLAQSVERRFSLLSEYGPASAQLPLPLFDGVSEDDQPDAVLAAPGLHDADREREWLLRLLALARIAAGHESKVRALCRLLARAPVPALVFTEYRDTLERVSAQLGGGVVHLHGGLTPAERQEAAARFTHGDARVMLATDAASEGLNLQLRCNLVVNLELPWSPVRLEQRIGRVDRIGQRSRVHAVNLVARRTIEEHVIERLLRRAAHAHAALDATALPMPLDVAGHAIGGAPLAAPPHPRTSAPPHPRTFAPPPPLRARAAAEAARLATARALLPHDEAAHALDRPLLSNLSRRRMRPRCCWAFRLRFVDARDDVPWESLFGIGRIGTRQHVPAASWLRATLALHQSVDDAAAAAAMEIERRIRDSMAAVTALAAARERAISGSIAQRGARVAAALVQRSLFDRQAERAAAAQQAVVDEALRRCAARMRQIEASQSISASSRELVFAVVLD